MVAKLSPLTPSKFENCCYVLAAVLGQFVGLNINFNIIFENN